MAATPEHRIFEFSYDLLPLELPATEAIEIYLPLPSQNEGQRVLLQTLQSSLPGEIRRDPVYGNDYYHIHRPAGNDEPISANLRWIVSRTRVTAIQPKALSAENINRYLAANRLVPVGHDMLRPILDEIYQQRVDDSPQATAHAIYNWVVDNVEYKKVGTGWGNGDTFWACSERYGNCTDFHALFISLARSEGIPARFEIGFPIPSDRSSGEIDGYHCWVQFYLPGQGWIPIDASEAAKQPERREEFFGSQPADRIHFTTGRDLVLSPAGESKPLNYFIYPYIEVGGRPLTETAATRFSFVEVAAR